ncbi:MAG: hypothetical protein EXR79_14285 [Myxococcales bacterium]|nr:hypothetical protein [Myxococcales bacterium]
MSPAIPAAPVPPRPRISAHPEESFMSHRLGHTARRVALTAAVLATAALTACGSDDTPVTGAEPRADLGLTDAALGDGLFAAKDSAFPDIASPGTDAVVLDVPSPEATEDVLTPADTPPPPDGTVTPDAAPDVPACAPGPCEDGDACTEADTCDASAKCTGKPKTCDDGNVCTTDACEPAKGCVALANAATCSDDNGCSMADACDASACKAGKSKNCDDTNACTKDACEPKTGTCSHDALDTACDDGNSCTSDDGCKPGLCTGKPIVCDDGNPCSTDKCDNKTGCAFLDNQGPCNDNNACTDFDKCDAAKCKGAAKDATDCDDGNPCTTDACDKKTGCTVANNTAACDDGNGCTQGDACKDAKCGSGVNTCDCQSDAECAPKEDGNACNGTLFCDKAKGQCVVNPKTVVTCGADGNGPCAQQKCDVVGGKCALQPIKQGNPCDADGSACTPDDACTDGTCKAGVALKCDDGNPCTTDSCDAGAGCKNTANESACDADGTACTANDACSAKVCIAGKPKVCNDDNACTADACDPKSGACNFDGAAKAGEPCDADGSNCTVSDACAGGACVKGKALACEDNNGCTIEVCDPKNGCVHLAAAATCDADGDACTVGDQCDAKACMAGPKKACDDGDACTADACDSKTGGCSAKAITGCGGNCGKDADCDDKNLCTDDTCSNGKCALATNKAGCDDGNACTKSDDCSGGACGGAPVLCDDGKVCTTNACAAKTGCSYPNNLAFCEDGDLCTHSDQCKDGACATGKPKACDDGDACTKDSCNPGDGTCKFNPVPGCGAYCIKATDCDDKNPCTDESCDGAKCSSKPNTIACDDVNACTLNDVCQAGKCQPGAAKNCGDNNVCTVDACAKANGACSNLALAATATCDDSNACTAGDNCGGVGVGGNPTCVGAAKVCDDGNACTNDTCNAASAGCVFTNNTLGCEDGAPCTAGEACQGGKCVAGATLWVEALAGSGVNAWADGTGSQASFHYPLGIAVDAGGNSFIADTYNHRIRKVTPAGVVTTLAGGAAAGYVDGKGTSALLNFPHGIALDGAGNLLIADHSNDVLRKLTPDGTVTTLAGTGAGGSNDGDALLAKFNRPFGIAVGPGGLVAIADGNNHRIRLLHPKTGKVTTLAGSAAGWADDPDGTKAKFNLPIGVAFDAAGNLFVADQTNHRIRKVTPTGAVTTLAGSGVEGLLDDAVAVARFRYPWGIAVGPDGVVYVADRYNHRIRRIVGGAVSTWIATGQAGFLDGPANLARLHYPAHIAFDPAGYLYVADGHNHRIRRVRDGSNYCQIGGQCWTGGWTNPANGCQSCNPKASGTQWSTATDGAACQDGKACTGPDVCANGACAGTPTACDDKDACTQDACDAVTGQCGYVAIVGCGGNCTKDADCDDKNPCTDDACKANKCGNANNALVCSDNNPCTLGDTCAAGACVPGNQVEVSTLAGGTVGWLDGKGTAAQFRRPLGIDIDTDGTVYTAEYENHTIRKIAPDGTVTTVAGSGFAGYADAKGKNASFSYPIDVKIGPGGKLYVADRYNHRIRVIDPDGNVSTFAGAGPAGGANGPVAAAQFNEPLGVAVSAGGLVLVTEYQGHRVRRIQGGIVSTLAGSTAGWADGKGAAAKFNGPIGIAIDGAGDAIVVDHLNHRIRKVAPDGSVTTVAGSGVIGYQEGDAAAATFNHPWGVAVDRAGTIYVADRGNHRVRTIRAGIVAKLAANGIAGFKDGWGTGAQFNSPTGVAVDRFGQVWIGDDQTHRVRKIVDGTAPCLIGGTCYANGVVNAANTCQGCEAGKSGVAWTTRVDGATCGDGKACTAPDQCKAGSCGTSDVVCDDSNKCSTDSCDAASGACLFKPILGCGGYCEKDAQCDDQNGCTTDACTANKCVFAPNVAPCDDDNPCTLGDACKDGKCGVGTANWLDTVAGSVQGYVDATGTAAQFAYPYGVVPAGDGTLFVADSSNHRIRRIALDGTVTTFAGSGNAGFLDAKGTVAWFSVPVAVAFDGKGVLYVVDRDNHAVRKVAADGSVTALAGGGIPGLVDSNGGKARFNTPYSIAVTPAGVAYVADYGNHRVRRIQPNGDVSTLAGAGAGYADGVGSKALFNQPIGVALDPHGNLIVAEHVGHRIRKVTPGGVVTTVAGTGIEGLKDGDPLLASFRYPLGVAVDSTGAIYVADRHNHRIRKIAGGAVLTVAGNGGAAWKDGIALQGSLHFPANLALDANGALFISDGHNMRIRRMRTTANACAIAGACWGDGLDNPAQPCQVCDGAKASTQWSAKADTAACNDGDYCSVKDTCGSGLCIGASDGCDDANVCTADACDSKTGACSNGLLAGCAP